MGKYKKYIYKSSSFSSDNYEYIGVNEIKEIELKNVLNRLNNMADLLSVTELNRLKLKKIRLKKELDVINSYRKKKKVNNKKKKCFYCNMKLKNIKRLDSHISTKHQDKWEEYTQDDKVKLRIDKQALDRCEYCGLFVKKINEHLKKCQRNKKEIKEEKTTLTNIEKIENSEEKNSKLKEQIPKDKVKSKSTDENAISSKSIKNDLLDAKRKHEGEIKEIEIELNPTVIQNIDAYIKKAQKEYEENLKNAPTKTTTHIVTRNVKVGRQETKWFLEKQYRGLCQICGFTFTKRKKGTGQYFELFDWFSEKITKQKVNVVQAGSSLSLCARCHAGVKYGSFKTNLVDILEKLDVKSMSFDEFVSKISTTVENRDIPMCYGFIENDMYKVDIRLFNKEEFIFYTEEHFMHLFVMLKSRGEL